MVQRRFNSLGNPVTTKDLLAETAEEAEQRVLERLTHRVEMNSYTEHSSSRAILAEWRRGPVPMLHIELSRLHGTESIAIYPDEAFGLAKWLHGLHERFAEED